MNRRDRRRQAASARHEQGTGGATFAWAGGSATVPLPGEGPAAAPPPRGVQTLTDRGVFEAVYRAAADALRAGPSPAALRRAVARAGDQGERMWQQVRPGLEAKGAFACRSGCSWCCTQQVALLPAEALAIADHVRARFTPAQRAALAERLARLDAETRGLSALGRRRRNLPCAFLVEGRCSIYAVRPLRCRGLHSRDAEICRWAAENPDEDHRARGERRLAGPYVVESAMMMDVVLRALAALCHDRGLNAETLELAPALRIALDAPDAAARYLAGERVFAGAGLPPAAHDGEATAPRS